jgi:cellulose synthase/poly-beta-1,6-N-acetylglucosamine synthase-like glycosyltransferase
VAIAVAVVLLVAHGLHLLTHYRRCADGCVRIASAFPPARPSVSVIIPARNEARDLGATIESVLLQQGVDLEVLIVDDHSVDETAAIARHYAAVDRRVRLLPAPSLPDAWCGKPHAQAHGAAHATHSLLLFADADVRFAPAAVASAVSALENRGVDLVTLLPAAELQSFWERAVQPVMASIIFYSVSFAKVNDPADPQSVGVGAFLLVRRSIYDAVGGHAAIRNRIVDDYALAQTIKRAGGRLWLADGRDLISIRMYHSLGEIWRGWSKNLYEGLRLPSGFILGNELLSVTGPSPVVLGLLLGYLVTTFGLPVVVPFWATIKSTDPMTIAAAWGLFVAFLTGWASLCHRVGIGRGWAPALPVGALVVAGIAMNSAGPARAGGGLVWRGRQYRVSQ